MSAIGTKQGDTAPNAAPHPLHTLLDKRYRDTPIDDMPDLPVDAISGVSAADAVALKSSLGIKTIRDLATHKHVRSAHAIVDATTLATLDEIVASFRVTGQLNRRVGPLALAEVAGGADDAESLYDMIQDSKAAPGSTAIAVVDTSGPAADPAGKPTQDALSIYNDMMTLNSLANVVAMSEVYKAHPAKYDITKPDEASAFIQAQVVNLNDTLNRRLGAYATVAESTQGTFDKKVATADLHLAFLTELFEGFSFSPATITKLDSILTTVRQTLENLKISATSTKETLDHLIVAQYIEPMTVPGLDQPILTGKLRLFYLQIDQTAWEATIGKQHASYVHFKMNYVDTKFAINHDLVSRDLEQITKTIEKFTGQSFDAMKKDLSPTAVAN